MQAREPTKEELNQCAKIYEELAVNIGSWRSIGGLVYFLQRPSVEWIGVVGQGPALSCLKKRTKASQSCSSLKQKIKVYGLGW